MTTIRYFIPEDGDTEDHPNIFLMSKPTQSGFSPRLRDIKESFPMPGSYHFRFKAPLIPGTDREKGSFAVWMDCADDDQHVGVWRNTIFAKVTRISMDDDEDVADFQDAGPAHVTVPAAAHTTRQSSARTPAARPPSTRAPAPAPVPAAAPDILGVFDEQPRAQPQPSSNGHASSSSANLLGVPSPNTGQTHGGGEGSLLDMNGPAYSAGGSSHSSNHNDFLGMTAGPVGQTPDPSAPTPVPVQAPSSYGNRMAGQQQGRPAAANNNAFNTFSNNNGPFGGLEWK